MADGDTQASRVVGGDIERPVILEEESAELVVVEGVKCAMPYTVKFVPPTGDVDLDKVKGAVVTETERLLDVAKNSFSLFEPKSEINHINNLRVGEKHTMTRPMREVVLAAEEVYKRTRGAFDPGLSPLISLYKKALVELNEHEEQVTRAKKGGGILSAFKKMTGVKFSDDAEAARKNEERLRNYFKVLFKRGLLSTDTNIANSLERLRKSASLSAFDINEEKRTIARKEVLAKLDLNGIAKGWAVDEIVKSLHDKLRINHMYVEWAGDIKVKGRHPDKRKWQVAVVEPPSLDSLEGRAKLAGVLGRYQPQQRNQSIVDSEMGYIAVLSLNDGEGVATSGDYEQLFAQGSRLVSHILSPKTGRLIELTSEDIAQATVVNKSCMYADALATAAMALMNPVDSRRMLEPLRTGLRKPITNFLLYCRGGPRVLRLNVPGVEHEDQHKRRMKYHDKAEVVIVGAGLAGLSAAVEAADAGAKVVVLEKESKTGGNSAKATSGINAWGTETQAQNGVADEERLFERDTFLSGEGGEVSISLVRTLSTKSASAVHWLLHKFKVPLTVLSQLGGHSAKRTHRAPPKSDGTPVPIGYLIMNTLRGAIVKEYKGKIEIKTNCKVTKLLHGERDGFKFVHGVEYEEGGKKATVSADSIVLATGGFGFDRTKNGMMAKYRKDLFPFPTTNGPFATGDGLLLCKDLNVNLVDMDKVQLHPTGFIDPNDPSKPVKFLAPEAIRGSGAILVNQDGHRFINELDLRSVVSKGIIDNCREFKKDGYTGPRFAYCILSPEGEGLFGKPMMKFYKDRQGLFQEAASPKDIAGIIGCKEKTILETLNSYAAARESGLDKSTGKGVFPSSMTAQEDYYLVAMVTPSIHYTMGGLEINAAGEVLEKSNPGILSERHPRHIRGLFAAGEVTGGVHGNNRLGGNSLLECVVFGRIAGERAACINQRESEGLKSGGFLPLVLRETRDTDRIYGRNTRELKFNLNGALQHTGMKVGQFISIQGTLDGETLTGYFSPITRPDDEGSIGILARTDAKGGPIVNLLEHIRPGSVVSVKAMGGLLLDFTDKGIFYEGREIKRFGLMAGGTGIAPMVQICLAYINYAETHPKLICPEALNVIYAAEGEADLAFMTILQEAAKKFSTHFRFYPVLNNPPLGWTKGVGFVTPDLIKERLVYPPQDDQLIVMCGPPIFEKIMRGHLARLGFGANTIFGYS